MLSSPDRSREAGVREAVNPPEAASPQAETPTEPEAAPSVARAPSAEPSAAEEPALEREPSAPSAQAIQPENEAERRSQEALRTIRRTAETRRASPPESMAKALPPRALPQADPKGVLELPLAPRRAETASSEAAEPAEQPAAQKPAPATVVDDSRLEREMGMLAMAQRVLTSDPERALRLARQGEQEFAGSMFTHERQQVLLLALIELGRTAEARRLAKPYLERYPNGPFSDRLRRALANAR
jgi:hypothetical protein